MASGVSRNCGCEPNHQIEEFLALHHLGGRLPADGGLDEAVDVGDIDTVPGDLVRGQC